MLTAALDKITENQDLTEQEAIDVIHRLDTGKVNTAQIAAFLAAIRTKGETIPEITGLAKGMLEKALKINTNGMGTVVDSCGTGGDRSNSFNISTASAIVASAAGLAVAKHLNYSITSKCGSSNVLEALGIPLLTTAGDVENNLKEHSIAFIHAPYFHKSTFHVNQVRKELKARTIFNYLGPLTNPARPVGQVVGVSRIDMLPKIISVLRNIGCKRALAVSGMEPVIDEISICGKTMVYALDETGISNYQIKPEDFGMNAASMSDIVGGDPDFNARIIRDIFTGTVKGAKLDVLLLNAAAVLWVGGKVTSLTEGVEAARHIVDSGKALEKLKQISA